MLTTRKNKAGIVNERPLTLTVPTKPGATHKHQQVASTLRQMIDSLAPGDRLPSVTDLEEHFGVTNTTVEAAMGTLRREGLIVRRRGSGTYVAERRTARAGTVSTGRVAVSAMPQSQVFMEIVHAVEATLTREHLNTMLVLEADADIRIKKTQALWQDSEVDGIIYIGTHELEYSMEAPSVVIGQTMQDGVFSQVSVDNTGAGRKVGEYFWSLGHQQVGTVLPHPAGNSGRRRLEGLRSLWQERGGHWNPAHEVSVSMASQPFITARQSVADMRALLEPLYRDGAGPTALFAFNDEIAVLVIRALEDLGKQVPVDVSIVGFDDAGLLAAHYRPSLSTVRMPAEVLGSLAVQVLRDQIADPQGKPRILRLPAELIVRESSGPPPPLRP